jgi:hypothetical protein
VKSKGIVFEDKADIIAVFLLEFLEGRDNALAIRALEVGDLDDSDPSAARALDRRVSYGEGIDL